MTPERLMQIMIEIGELPSPNMTHRLESIDPYQAFHVGHGAALVQVVGVLRRELDKERILVGKAQP